MSPKSEQLQIRVTPAEKAALKRLARRAGQDVSSYVLSRAVPSGQLRFDSILRQLGEDSERRYAFAELEDFLKGLAPSQLEDAVRFAELETLSPFIRNYVAALVERTAGDMGVQPPAWVREVPSLEAPQFATELRSLRPWLLRVSPVAFKRRNIFIDPGAGRV